MLKQFYSNRLAINSFSGLLYKKAFINKEVILLSAFTGILAMVFWLILSFFIDLDIVSLLSLQAVTAIILFILISKINNFIYSLDESIIHEQETRLKFTTAQAIFTFYVELDNKKENTIKLQEYFDELFPLEGLALFNLFNKYNSDPLRFYKQLSHQQRLQLERYFLVNEINIKE